MRFVLALLILVATPAAFAVFQVPSLAGPVMDQGRLLSPAMVARISGVLQDVRSRGGSQLQILIVPSLEGTPIEQASIQIVDAWKLGSAKEDNGILLLMALKERALRIEVGQGREGVLPDVIAKRIIADVIAPAMRAGDPDRAVFAGVLNILKYSDPEILQQIGESVPPTRKSREDFNPLVIFALVFLIIFLQVVFGRGRHSGGGFRGGGFGGGGFGGGGFGGGFGGGSGGGWGGGGGGFSGGGASGNW